MFASAGQIDWPKLVLTTFGLALVMAGACIFNNLADAKQDALMDRTRQRVLPGGQASGREAGIVGMLTSVAGFATLLLFTSRLTFFVAVFGFAVYVTAYTPLKKRTRHATLVGSLAGSAPPVVGYVSAKGQLDASALYIFGLWATWQMPHFYAIAIRRLKDYRRAGIPAMPVVKGLDSTVAQSRFFIGLFGVVGVAFAVFGQASQVFGVVVLLVAGWWLAGGLNFKPKQAEAWAKKQFIISLKVLVIVCLALSLDWHFN